MSAPVPPPGLSPQAEALFKLLFAIGTDIRSIEPSALRPRDLLHALLYSPEVERRLGRERDLRQRAEMASRAISDFRNDHLSDRRDRLALEAALAMDHFDGQIVERRIEVLEAAPDGMSRHAFKRRRRKVLGLLAQWLLHEMPVEPKSSPAPIDDPETFNNDTARFRGETLSLVGRAWGAAFAALAGLELYDIVAASNGAVRLSSPFTTEPWIELFYERHRALLTAAQYCLFEDTSDTDHPTSVDLFRRRLAGPLFDRLRDNHLQLISVSWYSEFHVEVQTALEFGDDRFIQEQKSLPDQYHFRRDCQEWCRSILVHGDSTEGLEATARAALHVVELLSAEVQIHTLEEIIYPCEVSVASVLALGQAPFKMRRSIADGILSRVHSISGGKLRRMMGPKLGEWLK